MTTEAIADPSAISTIHDFISWGTQRAPWQKSVRWEGAQSRAGSVLDAINLV